MCHRTQADLCHGDHRLVGGLWYRLASALDKEFLYTGDEKADSVDDEEDRPAEEDEQGAADCVSGEVGELGAPGPKSCGAL